MHILAPRSAVASSQSTHKQAPVASANWPIDQMKIEIKQNKNK